MLQFNRLTSLYFTFLEDNEILGWLQRKLLCCFKDVLNSIYSIYCISKWLLGCLQGNQFLLAGKTKVQRLKGIVHSEMKILLSFTHPHVTPNLHESA